MLFHELTRFTRRGATLIGAATIAMTAACSDNTAAPTSPVAKVPATGANATVWPLSASVTVRIKDINGKLIPEFATVYFVTDGGVSTVVKDNDPADKDVTPGFITTILPKSSSYKVCLMTDTEHYAIDVFGSTNCSSLTSSGGVVDLGSLVMRKFPVVYFSMRDEFNQPLLGTLVRLTAGVHDGFDTKVRDGTDPAPFAGTDGNIAIRANRPGTYHWCELDAPAGYYAVPTCGDISLSWEMTMGLIVGHKRYVRSAL